LCFDELVPETAIQLLRQHGVQVTAQRLAIMRVVAEHPHATADQLGDEVRSQLGSISRQSVYDSLGMLVDKNLVRRIQPAGSPARYETRVGDNHHHLICRSCRTMFDVDCATGEVPCLTADDNHGFEVDEAEVIYWGRCPTCRTSASSATAETARTSQKNTEISTRTHPERTTRSKP
jgi:Fe2+ or Zn2+ uptake regulation protein